MQRHVARERHDQARLMLVVCVCMCVCVFSVLACLHMLWATARLGSARAAAVSNLCAIETYEMQKCSPEKQQQRQIQHEARQ